MKAPREAIRDKSGALINTRSLSANLRSNLVYLCSFYNSISEVCRRLGINRQQFNKYTSGTAFPSVFILTRIANFFGVEVEELCMPPRDLKQIFERRNSAQNQYMGADKVSGYIKRLSESSSPALDSYTGLYHRYYYSFDQSGHVVRSLFSIRHVDGVYLTRHIERINYEDDSKQRITFKYEGVAVFASSCIFITEIETLLKSCVASAAFPIIPRPGQSRLFGIQTSLSSSAGRPGASRVVLERISPSVPLRQAFRLCGIFNPHSSTIKPEILALIDNTNPIATALFVPRVS